MWAIPPRCARYVRAIQHAPSPRDVLGWVGGWVGACVPCLVLHISCPILLHSSLKRTQRMMHAWLCGFVASTKCKVQSASAKSIKHSGQVTPQSCTQHLEHPPIAAPSAASTAMTVALLDASDTNGGVQHRFVSWYFLGHQHRCQGHNRAHVQGQGQRQGFTAACFVRRAVCVTAPLCGSDCAGAVVCLDPSANRHTTPHTPLSLSPDPSPFHCLSQATNPYPCLHRPQPMPTQPQSCPHAP